MKKNDEVGMYKLNKELVGVTKKMTLDEKRFAQFLTEGLSIEKSYIQAFGDVDTNGIEIPAKQIKSKAEALWRKPMIQRYILEIEKGKSDTYVRSITKELMAHNIIPIYRELVEKSKDILINDSSKLHPKDVLKFTLDYGSQITTLLGLNENEMSSTEDKLRELIHKVDVSVSQSYEEQFEQEPYIDIDEYRVDDEKEKEDADAMLMSVKLKGF